VREGRPEEAGAANRGFALLRLALVPVATLVEAIVPHPELNTDVFPAVLVAVAAYGLAMLGLELLAPDREPPPVVTAVLDLLAIAALVYASGGARSELRLTFFVLPLGAALRLSPRITALWSLLALVAYLVVALPHPTTDRSRDIGFIVSQAVLLAWVSAAAIMLATLVQRRQGALEALAASRRRLARQALDAEARERRRLAEALHDEAIQNVLAARQEVADVARGVEGAADRARGALDEAQRQLRQEVFAMHPLGLERAGLGPVLETLAADAARRGGFATEVVVDPDAASVHADLLLATARELLANAAKHSGAREVDLRVDRQDGAVRLRVADDGRGVPAAQLDAAVAEGHIGLASLAERVEAVGGRFEVAPGPGGAGTLVTVLLPAVAGPSRVRAEQ
jgi:two-component system NarL family sensor kinase